MIHCIAAVHFFEQAIVSALDGKVHMIDHFMAFSDGIDGIVIHVLGMTRHIPDPFDAFYFIDSPEQAGKIVMTGQVFPVGIDILAQQSNFFVSCIGNAPDFFHDSLDRTADFPAPYVRNDAIGTEIIAPVHDGDPGEKFLEPFGRKFMKCRLMHI